MDREETRVRLIDADKLLNQFPNDLPYKAAVKRVLMQAATVDAVPVVRCKACANFRQNAHGVCWCGEYGGAIAPEDYCSRAVRKNEPHAR